MSSTCSERLNARANKITALYQQALERVPNHRLAGRQGDLTLVAFAIYNYITCDYLGKCDQSAPMSGYPASTILFKRPRTGFEIIHLDKQLEWNLLKMHPALQPIVIESDTQKQIHRIHTTRSGQALTETASRCIMATYPR
ncbi:Hypothetical_protein [Hexamita inflata]|uniref:Hypothetical_protein n=1 Tax=Hexamita inflata TaxID=28002 RepID=A0ABP1JT01_9EUKA